MAVFKLLWALAVVPLASFCAERHKLLNSGRASSVDIAIVGGGASGMHAAIRLHQSNKSVMVIEPQNRTGGHVATYLDPVTDQAIDVGVLYYHNISAVTDFASYLDVPLEPVSLLSSEADKQVLVDFSTGKVLTQASIDALGESVPAYTRYYQLLSQYEYLQSGFHLPSPVPEDLSSSWGQLITKYNLTGLAFNVNLFNQGWVDILNMPALYVLKGFGQLLLQSYVSGYELRTASRNNQELFDAAARKLGPQKILLNSTVKHIHRRKKGVILTVATSSGTRKISAKKLLITAPPLLSTLRPMMRLNAEEADIFGQFSCGYYWNGIVKDSGLPDDVSLYGVGSGNPYYIADQPGLITVIPTGVSGLHRVYYGSPSFISDEEVSQSIVLALAKSAPAIGFDTSKASIPFIRSHAPYHCTVSAEQIEKGFYDRLLALQGKQRTYYTGAALQAHDSGSIWKFTEDELLPRLLE